MRKETKEFWCAIGKCFISLVQLCNIIVFSMFPFVAIGLVGYNRIPDAVACLAFWAIVATGRLTIKPPATK